MGSAFAALFIVLSTLALLSQGYVIDESCARDFGKDIAEGVAAAMGEGWVAVNLVNSHATQKREDGMDDTRSQMFKAVEPAPGTSPQMQAEMRATQLGKVQGQYAAVIRKLPWQKKDQSPRTVDRLKIDKLNLYCGDKMLTPTGEGNHWFDTQTNYVYTGEHWHYGDPTAQFCNARQGMDTRQGMVTLIYRDQVHPPARASDMIAVVVICPVLLDKTRAFTVQKALAEGRIYLGQSLNEIAEVVTLSLLLFHEMFHAALSDLYMLPYNGISETYNFQECAALSFSTAIWNPNSLMLYAASRLFYHYNPDFFFEDGYLGSRALAMPQQPGSQTLPTMPAGGPGPIWGQR